jgi:undecaprenyl-diphosphatase
VSATSRVQRVARRSASEARGVSHRLGLTWRGWLLLAAGVASFGVALIVLGGVSEDVTQHNGLATSDPSHLRFFIDHRPDFLVHASRIVTEFGNAAIVAIIAIAAGLLLWRRGLPVLVAAVPAIALGIATVLGDIAKHLVDRGRPPASVRLIVEGEPSFPSGHATNAAAVYIALGLVVALFVFKRPLLRVAVIASSGFVVAAIGASRLVLGVHWPSDVLAGWALGAAVALGVTIAATLVVALMPKDPAPPATRFRRAVNAVGQLLRWDPYTLC